MPQGPRVNIYDQKEGVGGLPNTPRVTPDMAGAGYGRALASLGSDLGQAGDAYLKQQERERKVLEAEEDRRALVDAHKLAASAEVDAITTSAGLEESNATTPFGQGERVNAAIDKYTGKALESVTNPRAREYVETQMAQVKTRQLVRAITWERQQTKTNNVASVTNIGEELSNAAYADHNSYASGLETLRSAFELTGLSAEEALRDKLENGLAYKTALGYAKRNPSLALNFADIRAGLKPTDRPPAHLTAEQRGQWQTLKPADRGGYAEAIRQYNVQKETGAKGDIRVTDQTNPSLYIQPPDTEVAGGGTPGKTGIPFWDKLTPEQSIAIRNQAEQDYKVDISAIQAQVRGFAADSSAAAAIGKSKEIAPLSLYVAGYGEEMGREMHRQDSQIPIRGARRGTLTSLSYADLVATVNRPIPEDMPPGDYAKEVASRKSDQELAASILDDRQKDWIGSSSAMGVATTVKIDWGNPAAAEVELRNRQAIALSADRFAPGASRTALTVAEAASFRDVLHRIPANDAVRVLRTMRQSLTDPSVYNATIQAIAPDSPSTQIAASIATATDPAAIATAEMIVRGERLLNPNKAQRKEDGKATVPTPLPTDFRKEFADIVGEAFAANPRNFDSAMQATAAWYVGTMTQRGLMGKENADPAVVRQAIDAVVGQPVSFGAGKVLAPRGMDNGQAKTLLQAAWSDAMEKNGITGTAIDNASEARLINVPNAQGQYYIAAGDAPYRGADGLPIVLNINIRRGVSGVIRQ